MSFAEKRLLIIISLTEQLDKVANDFGKTINCGIMLKNIVKNFVNLCKKGVNIIKKIIFANDKDLLKYLDTNKIYNGYYEYHGKFYEDNIVPSLNKN